MFPFALSSVPSTPSITSLTARTPCNSRCNACSRAAAASSGSSAAGPARPGPVADAEPDDFGRSARVVLDGGAADDGLAKGSVSSRSGEDMLAGS